MSQVTDYTIANDTGANVRSDINAVLGAIQTLNSGSSEPSANVAFQLSVNTTTSLLKIRNAANKFGREIVKIQHGEELLDKGLLEYYRSRRDANWYEELPKFLQEGYLER